jgi:hypothetical protein
MTLAARAEIIFLKLNPSHLLDLDRSKKLTAMRYLPPSGKASFSHLSSEKGHPSRSADPTFQGMFIEPRRRPLDLSLTMKEVEDESTKNRIELAALRLS